MVVHDLKLGSLDYKSEVLTSTCISTVSPQSQTLSSYCVSLWMLQKELHTVHCSIIIGWAFSSLDVWQMKTACLSLEKIRCHKVLVPFLLL